MNPIDNIMALAKEYRDAIDDHGPKRQALRAAIEQALGQAGPPPQTPFDTCPTCEALARAVMMDQGGTA